MGRVEHERHVHFNYFPELVDHYKEQTEEFKEVCNTIGREYGYSGLDIFYIWFVQYWSHNEAGIDRRGYRNA